MDLWRRHNQNSESFWQSDHGEPDRTSAMALPIHCAVARVITTVQKTRMPAPDCRLASARLCRKAVIAELKEGKDLR
jgi:hypothetical protein